jgi:hypothetical protein
MNTAWVAASSWLSIFSIEFAALTVADASSPQCRVSLPRRETFERLALSDPIRAPVLQGIRQVTKTQRVRSPATVYDRSHCELMEKMAFFRKTTKM